MSRGFDRRQRPALAALTLAVALSLTGCGPTPGGHYDPLGNQYPLDAWVAVAQDTTGRLRPYVQVSVPYRSLVFHREGLEFHSGIEVRVVAWRDDEQVGGGVGRARVDLGTFAETETDLRLTASAPLQVRGDQNVSLTVAANVLESSRIWRRDLRFSPLSLAAMPVWIVGVDPGLPTAPDGDGFLLADADSLRLQVTLQRRREVATWPDAELDLVSEVTAASLEQPQRQSRPLFDEMLPGETLSLTETLASSRLPFGRCRIQVQLELAHDDTWLVLPREPALQLVNLRVELSDDLVWQQHVQWLADGWTEVVVDSLGELDPALRPAAWTAVWQRRAPAEGLTAAQAERRYLLRVVAADDRFGDHRRGSLSDRGRRLIRWGEPARVETFPDTRTPGAVWEIWEYPSRRRRVLFFDAHGMGDYRFSAEEPLAD